MAKWVYEFGDGSAEGKSDMRDLLGGKGANLAEMANLGLPVPPGFTVTTEVCTYFYDHGKTYPPELEAQVAAALERAGTIAGHVFGDENSPLLVSVRSGSRASMPGMMDTVLNLGLTDRTVEALARPARVDVNQAVSGMRALLTSTLGGTIQIVCDLDDDAWPALADPTQLELVLLNLTINARDAMQTGGTITIVTSNAVLAVPLGPTDPPPGEYVVLHVRDDGAGMTPETLSRVFEPFFTTKGGRGSGLGLPQVLGIAQQLGGGVRVTSEPGRGTTVGLYMPRCLTEARPAPSTDIVPDQDQGRALHGRTVLLVDDDDDVRIAARALLGQLGCIVVEESEGRSAIARVRRPRAARPRDHRLRHARHERRRHRRPDPRDPAQTCPCWSSPATPTPTISPASPAVFPRCRSRSAVRPSRRCCRPCLVPRRLTRSRRPFPPSSMPFPSPGPARSIRYRHAARAATAARQEARRGVVQVAEPLEPTRQSRQM